MGTLINNGPGPALLRFKSTGRIDLRVGQTIEVPDEVIEEFLSPKYPRPGMRSKVTALYSKNKEPKKSTVIPPKEKTSTTKTVEKILDEKINTEDITPKEFSESSTKDEDKSSDNADYVSPETTVEKAGAVRGVKTLGKRAYKRRSSAKSSSTKKE